MSQTEHGPTPAAPATSAAAATGHVVGHGNSVAAWTAVGIICFGALLSCLAFPFALPWLFWVGIAVVVIGAISGKVLTAMGFGEQPHSSAQPHP